MLKEMAPIWRESYQKASEELDKSILQLAFALFLFAMIDAAQLSSLELFGLSFRTTGVPLLVLLIVATFLYYRCMALIYFSAVVESALRTAYSKFFAGFDRVGLCDLLMYPSILQIENTIDNLQEGNKTYLDYITYYWMMFEALAILILPLIGLIWASLEIIHNPAVNWIVSTATVFFCALVSLRGLLMMLYHYQE